MDAVYKKNLKLVSLVWGCSIILALVINMIVIAPQNQCKEQVRKQLAEKKHQVKLSRDSIVSAILKKINAGQTFIRTAPNTFALKTEASE